MDRAEAFYVGILGLTPCEQKPNWLFAGDHFSVHLMPSRPDLEQVNPARHFTLEVARLEEIIEERDRELTRLRVLRAS